MRYSLSPPLPEFSSLTNMQNGHVCISPELVSVRRYRLADFVARERDPKTFRVQGSYWRRTAYAGSGDTVPTGAAAE